MRRTTGSLVCGVLLAGILAAGLPGCDCGFLDAGWETTRDTRVDPTREDPTLYDSSSANTPPSVDDIIIPEWPPIGHHGSVSILVSDPEGLDHLSVTFTSTLHRDLNGTEAEVAYEGSSLGEGFGTLSVSVWDESGTRVTRQATDVLVDLTPPVAEIPSGLVRGDGWVEVWVGDAWILGGAELVFDDVTLTHEFPALWLDTLGVEWDRSIIFFPAGDLPATAGTATLKVTDAAGNRSIRNFDLVIDDEPPTVSLVEPEPGSVVTERFRVAVESSDNITESTSLELRAGGAPVATGLGPYTEITLDARDFALGELELTAVAVDEVGHRTLSSPVSVTVE